MPEWSDLHQALDVLREPALFLAGEMLEYENPAAARLLPDGLPAELRAAIRAGESGVQNVNGVSVELRLLPMEGGVLAILKPELDAAELGSRLPLILENLRRQMNNLAAAVHLVAPVVREGGKKYEEYLTILNQSFYRALRVVQGASLAVDVSSGGLLPRCASIDLAALCRELGEEVAPLAALAERSFTWEVGVDTLATVGDKGLLRQMLLELISNALRAAGEGGRAGLRLSVSGGQAVLTVWDSGAGLDLCKLESPDLTPGADGGMRLGLATARSIATLHGGALVLDSQAGEGTRAAVSLPLRPPVPGMVYTPAGDRTGGFSPVLTTLSDLLPYEVFDNFEE